MHRELYKCQYVASYMYTLFALVREVKMPQRSPFLQVNIAVVMVGFLYFLIPLKSLQDVSVEFSEATYRVREDGGSVSVTVVLSGATQRDVLVEVFTADGSADGEFYILFVCFCPC